MKRREKMIEEGLIVKVTSLELTPYINTSKLFKVISIKPYKEHDGWIKITNEEETIVTRQRFVEVV